MYKKYEREGVVSQEWVDNVVEFVEYCESSPNVDRLDNQKMRCPCKKCKNIKFCSSKIMLEHILRFGFTPNYFDWVDPGHAELQAQFFELREEARQNGLKVTDEEIWYLLVEGHNAKNRVPGVGYYARKMKKINPSSKPRRSSTSSSSAAEMAALKEQNQRLQEQLDNLTSNLSLTIQEEIRKLYGGNLPPRGYDDGMGGAGQPRIC
ncbi:unnamed protein product [Cuscuta campestris]|uniref:Transposase-associated domain-containing protein n=1 Tax=Cuscuta campestris TaxID=132261 RepID=A0A484KNE1_9ASTE|nr:unnamed protein product [Cuscuta campestris]